MMDFFFLFLSLVLLYIGAEISLNASEKIGKKLGLSPLMIGMLLVGLGTSLPEFFVSHIAAYRGSPQIAFGNIVGSNITNIFLVLGLSLFIVPIKLKGTILRKQVGLHSLLTLTFFALLIRQKFDLLTVLCLFAFFITYMVLSKKNIKKEVKEDLGKEIHGSFFKMIPTAVVGFALLYYGGELLVDSGRKVCSQFGLSEYVISAILLAFGTSFPELVTALVAAYRKKDTNLIIGNIIGSNIFNISFVLGTLFPYQFSITRPILPEALSLGAVSIFIFWASSKEKIIFKKTGAAFIAVYLLMIFYWLK